MKNTRIITIFLALALLITSVVCPTAALADDEDNSLVRNVVYIYNMSAQDIANIDVEGLKLTHINYAFVYVAESAFGDLGYITTNKGQFDLFNEHYYMGYDAKAKLQALTELKDKYPWLSICISIGGGDMEQKEAFAKLSTDEAAMQRFAVNVRQFLLDYNLDGVDLDWEVPDSRKEMKAYIQMAQLLREQLGPDAVVSAAVPCDTVFTELFTKKMVQDFDQALSFWNIMTYDLGNVGNYDFIAPLDFIVVPGEDYSSHIKLGWGSVRDGIANMAAVGVPYDKMVLGLAYFGLVNTDIVNGPTEIPHGERLQGNSSKPYYEDIAPYIADPSWTRLWNDVAQCPYLLQTDSNGRITGYITYDDAESIGIKLEFAQELGLGGAMCWTLNGDDSDYTLAKATASYINPVALTTERGQISEDAPSYDNAETTDTPTPTPEAPTTDDPGSDNTDAPADEDPTLFKKLLPVIIAVPVLVIVAVVVFLVLKKKK